MRRLLHICEASERDTELKRTRLGLRMSNSLFSVSSYILVLRYIEIQMMIVMTCSDLLTEYSAFNDLEIKGGTEKKWTALFNHLLFCH